MIIGKLDDTNCLKTYCFDIWIKTNKFPIFYLIFADILFDIDRSMFGFLDKSELFISMKYVN